MDEIPYIQTLYGILAVTFETADITFRHSLRLIRLLQLYGLPGLFLFQFGSEATWRMEAQVLGQMIDEDALALKEHVQSESTMISVAIAAIVAQVSVTGLSLHNMDEIHWSARGLLVLSLICALMAVYYATTQQRTMGCLLHAPQIRLWIRGGVGILEEARVVPSFQQFLVRRLLSLNRTDEGQKRPLVKTNPKAIYYIRQIDSISGIWSIFSRSQLRPCDPKAFNPDLSTVTTLKRDLKLQCFTPSVASVISLSTPQITFSTSLISLVVALGVYLRSLWAQKPDDTTGGNAWRNIFIMYVVGVGICIIIYSFSRIIQDRDNRGEGAIIEDYLDDWVKKNLDVVHG